MLGVYRDFCGHWCYFTAGGGVPVSTGQTHFGARGEGESDFFFHFVPEIDFDTKILMNITCSTSTLKSGVNISNVFIGVEKLYA